jgi:hypothetical protein
MRIHIDGVGLGQVSVEAGNNAEGGHWVCW